MRAEPMASGVGTGLPGHPNHPGGEEGARSRSGAAPQPRSLPRAPLRTERGAWGVFPNTGGISFFFPLFFPFLKKIKLGGK